MNDDFELVKRIFEIDENNSFGNTELEILKTEERLGCKLPEKLKEFYVLFGKNEKICAAINTFTRLEDLGLDDDGRLVVFYDNQSSFYLFFKMEELLKMEFVFHGRTYMNNNWKFRTQAIFSSIFSICLQAALYNSAYRAIKLKVGKKGVNDVHINFEKMWENLELSSISYFQNNPNQLIGVSVSEYSTMLAIASNNQRSFDEILELLNVDWDFLIKNGEVLIQ